MDVASLRHQELDREIPRHSADAAVTIPSTAVPKCAVIPSPVGGTSSDEESFLGPVSGSLLDPPCPRCGRIHRVSK